MIKKTIGLVLPKICDGGAEKVAADLSIYFERKGYKVVFFVKNKPSYKAYKYAGEVVVIPMSQIDNTLTTLEQLKILFQDAKELRRKKKEYKVDVVISFMQHANLLNILSRRNEKVIATLHSVVSNNELKEIIYQRWIYKFVYQLADKIILVSKYCKKDWIDNYGDLLHKTSYIYNPIGESRETKDKDLLNMKKSNTVISVARFHSVKQPWHIIRMFSKVVKEIPDAKLLMLGDGELLPLMKKLAKDMGMEENISFLGHVENVDDYLNMSKVFVVASKREAFPCSVIEAMRCGVPVVANNCPGGIKEALGARKEENTKKITLCACGRITPYLDGKKYGAKDKISVEEEHMANEVIKILLNSNLHNRYSNNCKKYAKRYHIDTVGSKWEKII